MYIYKKTRITASDFSFGLFGGLSGAIGPIALFMWLLGAGLMGLRTGRR